MTPRTSPQRPRSILSSGDFWGAIRSGPLLYVVLVIAILAAIITYVLRQEGAATRTKPAPYTYIGLPYQAVRASLCPGETLIYTATLDIHEPSSMVVIKTIANETGYNVPGFEQVRRAIYDQPTAPGQPIVVPEQITIPDLPPGRYRLLETRQLAGVQQAYYRVPFDVPGGCP